MSNLSWLKEMTRKKSKEIMDLSDEYWDTILEDISEMPEELSENPHSMGKFAVVSTLGLMMYMPGNARQLSDSFGRDSSLATGALKNVKGRGYAAKVSQGIEAATQVISRWEEGLEQAPALGKDETTEDLKNFIPLFQGLLSDKIAVQKQRRETEARDAADAESESLLGGEIEK
jgi:hypothetical protein